MEKIRLIRGIFLAIVASTCLSAQDNITLDYYLPNSSYDSAIPTPKSWLGFEVGERHASHDQLLGYMKLLSATSNRFRLQEYGQTYEGRPLICMTISAPANLARLEEIRTARRELANPQKSAALHPEDFPAVVYMGYSIHGNETSGANASLAVAYWLAAAQGTEAAALLENTVILFDPCFNPDGMQRFSSWVNSRRSLHTQPNPAADEFNEHWPGGRYNHYWFDLNRDWLVMQQPESEGRVRIFQEWLPNVLTDHHEMGSGSTFFFQPGEPSRVNPVTPKRNQELTSEIARYHAAALSEKGVLFYSGENYDDFYYGKGSTYPDANGAIGILFEQGSSRGSAQETANGLLTFPYTIRNQVITSFSTLKAVSEKRVELNNWLRSFYQTALTEAAQNPVKAYILQAPTADNSGLIELAGRILSIHGIDAWMLEKDVEIGGKKFIAGKAVVVPVEQRQYRLIRGIFERNTTFTDSIFYDISAWTLPDAFGLEWAATDNRYNAAWRNHRPFSKEMTRTENGKNTPFYACILPADAPGLLPTLAQLHKEHFRVKVSTETFTVNGRTVAPGSLVITTDRQTGNILDLRRILATSGIIGHAIFVAEGNTENGPWLGSNKMVNCAAPVVLMATGDGVSPTDAGEIWQYLDTRLGIPPVMVETDRLAQLDWSKYNVFILPDGRYNNLPLEKIKQFVENGGTLIATGGALRWLKSSELAPVTFRPAAPGFQEDAVQLPYRLRDDVRAARRMPGAIFNAHPDPSHPLCFGFSTANIPVFLAEGIYTEPAPGAWQNPLMLTKQPLLAGYLHASQQAAVSESSAVQVHTLGSGRIISFTINPNFRSFWWGTQRLMGNAVMFGALAR